MDLHDLPQLLQSFDSNMDPYGSIVGRCGLDIVGLFLNTWHVWELKICIPRLGEITPAIIGL